jgi:hypothetical protein
MSIILYIVSDLKCLNKMCPLVSQVQVVQPDIQSVLCKQGDCSPCMQGATNVDDLQKDVLHRTVLIIYSYKWFSSFLCSPSWYQFPNAVAAATHTHTQPWNNKLTLLQQLPIHSNHIVKRYESYYGHAVSTCQGQWIINFVNWKEL